MEGQFRYILDFDLWRFSDYCFCFWPLEREHGPAIRIIFNLNSDGDRMIEQPLPILIAIGSIHHDHILVGQVVNKDVIDNAAVFVAQQPVIRLALVDRCNIACGDELQEVERVGAAYHEAPHVADVEQASGVAHGSVLV